MKINRNASFLSFVAVLIGFFGGLWFNFSSNYIDASFWSSIFIGICTSGLISLGICLVSYFSIRNKIFFKLNMYLQSLDIILGSPLLGVESYLIKNIARLENLRTDYHNMQELTNDFKTILPLFFKYKQVKRIHKLMLSLSNIFALLDKDIYCNSDDCNHLIVEVKKFYDINEVEIKALCKNYDHYIYKKKKERAIIDKRYSK